MIIRKVPLSGVAETFAITLAGVEYRFTVSYRDTDGGGWVLDVANSTDNAGAPILCGIPLVTGTNLMAQFAYLGLNFGLFVVSSGDPLETAPTYDTLGRSSSLYAVTVT